MLTPERLGAYFEHRLSPGERAEVDQALAGDPESRRLLADQARLDATLRALLGSREAEARVRNSIFAVLRGASEETLTAGILAEAAAERRADRPGAPAPVLALGWDLRALWARWAWVAALASVLVAGFLAWQGVLRPAGAPEVGRFTGIVGAPTVDRGGRVAEPAPRAGDPVRFGDRIETGDADKAEIRFLDGTTLRLAFNTVVELPPAGRTRPADTNTLQRPPEVRLVQGQVWTQVAKRTNAPSYAIRTDAATAIARGTEFGVKLQRLGGLATNSPFALRPSPFASVLTVKEGIVDFTNAHGSVRATAMTESTATAASAPSEPRRLARLVAARSAGPVPWVILTRPLSIADAAQQLVGGGGWAGFQARMVVAPDAPAGSEIQVYRVKPSSPADEAGLRPGDVILSAAVRSADTLRSIGDLILLRPDEPLPLQIRRNREELSLTLTPARRTGAVPGPALETPDLAALENNRGVLLETHGELGPAIRAYGQAARADPGVALYRYNLGLALRKIGSLERATEELAAAVRLAPRSSPARAARAEILALMGHDEEALGQADAALADDPTWHGLWELKAQVLSKQRRYPEALAAAQAAVEREPDCVVAHSYVGGILRNLQRFPEAAAALRKALEIDPFQASLHVDLADVFLAVGQLAPAEASYRRALELDPDFTLAHRGLGDTLADRGAVAEAEQSYIRAIETGPDDPETHSHLADLYRAQMRQPTKAAERYQTALDLDPDHVGALSGMALLAAMRGDLAETERLLRRAAELAPQSAGVRGNLAEILRRQGRLDEAVVEFRQAIELDPDNTRNLENFAILLANRGEFAGAERLFRAALNRQSGIHRLGTLLNLGHLCEDVNHRPEEAEALFREALSLSPENPFASQALARLFANQGKGLDEALVLARQATLAQPDNPSFAYTLAWVQFQRGEWEAARATWESALPNATGQPIAAEIQQRLKDVEERIRQRR